MKISSAAAKGRPLSRQTAWGCFTTNLALPGLGSLMAGRRAGYVQVVLMGCGLVLTLAFGLRFMHWSLVNWSRLHSADADPWESLQAMWQVLRWALLGLGVFFTGWLWALGTSCQILRAAKSAERHDMPPRLSQ